MKGSMSVAEKKDIPVETTETAVRRWISENLVHGRIARDVELWNELQTALPALVAIIDQKGVN